MKELKYCTMFLLHDSIFEILFSVMTSVLQWRVQRGAIDYAFQIQFCIIMRQNKAQIP